MFPLYLNTNPSYKLNTHIPDFIYNANSLKDFDKNFQGGIPNPNKGSVSWLSRIDSGWEKYISAFNKAKHNIDSFKATTLYNLVNQYDTKKVKDILGKRFDSDTLIYNTDLFKGHPYNRENKISSCVLPLVKRLGATKVFVLGFDGQVGRFYDKRWKTKGFVGEYKFLDKWVKWQHITNMEIYSVTKCGINKHIPYMSFEEALKIDNEANN